MLKKIISLSVGVMALAAFAAVDVNRASQSDLDSIKGVGPTTSKKILAERKSRDFKDWPDLMDRVKGIGDAKASRLSAEGLTVNGHSYKDMSPPAASSAKRADSDKAKPAKPSSKPNSQEKSHK